MATESLQLQSHLPSLPDSQEPLTTPHTINIGTRKSALAVIQTEIVIEMLKKHWPQHDYKMHAISTMGDKNQITALHDFGAKSLWTHELEAMLLEKQVDFIVHSLKVLPPLCTVGAILPREDPRDALVLAPKWLKAKNVVLTLAQLPRGSVIGTSSVRRSAQLMRLYPHLAFKSVRGNVGTRLGKLDAEDSEYAAIILAAAGLIRVGQGHRISGFLESKNVEGVSKHAQDAHPDLTSELLASDVPDQAKADKGAGSGDVEKRQAAIGDHKWGMLHAVGQGALGIETREDDARVAELLAPIRCLRTTMACLAERSLMRSLEGGCSVPIGVETEWQDDTHHELTLRAIVVSIDGSEAAEAETTATVASDGDAEAFGQAVAAELVAKGADTILAAIKPKEP